MNAGRLAPANRYDYTNNIIMNNQRNKLQVAILLFSSSNSYKHLEISRLTESPQLFMRSSF
jgi:hypothetical protein